MWLKKFLIVIVGVFVVVNANAGSCTLIPASEKTGYGVGSPSNTRIYPISSGVDLHSYYYCGKNGADTCGKDVKIVFGGGTRFNWLGTFEGPVVYKCRVRMMDAFWEKSDFSGILSCKAFDDISLRKEIKNVGDGRYYFCRSKRYKENHCVAAAHGDICVATKDEADCIRNGNWDDKNRQCKPQKTEVIEQPDDNNSIDKPDDKKTKVSCRESRASLEGKACCDLPSSVAKWDGRSCVCLDKNQEFKIQNDRGVCVAKNQLVAKDECDCSNVARIVSNAWAKCGMENSAIANATTEINIQCNNGTNCNAGVLNQNINIVNIAIANCESEQSQTALKRVQSAVDALENDIRGLDRSVWKNAEGNFNTARLASDSVAGVVLGTAGGIITANVVKKNQLENGFDDIVCTINGQTVGGYGDEIIVGVQ